MAQRRAEGICYEPVTERRRGEAIQEESRQRRVRGSRDVMARRAERNVHTGYY